MARVRTIPKAVKEIKEKDPGTHINVSLLRKWVKRGLLSPIPGSGSHVLIDLEKVESLIAGGAYENS